VALLTVTGRGELVADLPAASVFSRKGNAHRWKEKRYSGRRTSCCAGSVRVTPPSTATCTG